MQKSGQSAFYLAYEDLQDVEIMNELAAYLDCPSRIASLDSRLKKQNPQPLSEKVSNFDDMELSLAGLDRFNLTRTPSFEPRRGPMVPSYVAAPASSLMYIPIRSGPEAIVRKWLAEMDGQDESQLIEGFNQKTLRQWKRAHSGHRSFTVLRHPVARAHAAFCERILTTGPGGFLEIRQTLRQQLKLPIPKGEPDDSYDSAAHRAAFLVFLKFLKANLSGRTNLRIDGAWASQQAVLQGVAGFGVPDMLVREDRMTEDFAVLASQIGKDQMPHIPTQTDDNLGALSEIYDEEIEAGVREVYQRDYMSFGFSAWRS